MVSRCTAPGHTNHVFAAEVLACRRDRIVGIDALQHMHELLFNIKDIGPLHAAVVLFGNGRRLFMTPAMAIADGPVRNRLGIVIAAVPLLPVFRFLITGRQCEIGIVDRAPTGRVLLDEERQHGVQILLEVLAIDTKESGSKDRRTSVPMVVHALKRPLSGAARNTASCAHVFSPESLCNLVNAIQIIQKRNAIERSRETCSWTYYVPWLVGFGENFRVSMRAWMVANGVKPEDHSGVSFVMPKYLPSS
jgi:hypothetical protein